MYKNWDFTVTTIQSHDQNPQPKAQMANGGQNVANQGIHLFLCVAQYVDWLMRIVGFS